MTSRSRLFDYIVPNLLTIGRIVLAILFPLVSSSQQFVVVVLGAVSDLLDGAFSRLFRVQTYFGQVLDPVADKTFVAAVLLTLMLQHRIGAAQLALVGARDLAVLAGSLTVVLLHGRRSLRNFPPRALGKLTTAAQFLFLADLVYHQVVRTWLLALTGVVSVLAGIDYLFAGPRGSTEPSPNDPSIPLDDETAELQHP